MTTEPHAAEPPATRAPGPDLTQVDAWWRAANYLAAGQIYLMDNPLLTEPLQPRHIKPRLLGHWGTSPGLNLVYAHLNRVIRTRGTRLMHITGPGHGGPAAIAASWLDGTYSEHHPDVPRDAGGMRVLFRRFSFPGGVPSHIAPGVPGSVHEGGELGYSLSHAFGAAFDNPGLVVACVIGDGEAETGPLAASWHGNMFLNPVTDGAVLPILHLNGWKIANPTVLSRLPRAELDALLTGYGWQPFHVEGDDPTVVHRLLADALDTALATIDALRHQAPTGTRVRRPMIVLRTPKGWTGPRETDGLPVEGTWRSHQVPLAGVRDDPAHLARLEQWLRSYRPGELFDTRGRPTPDVLADVPDGDARLGATPYANGGLLLRPLPLPDFRAYAAPVDGPGVSRSEPTRALGALLRDVMAATAETRDFRLFGPDETESNRLGAVLEVTGKAWQGPVTDTDRNLSPDGRVMEILSEHTCQGWLEGYLLTGRHGVFSSYEAFTHIVSSMFNQHAKWLHASREIRWRAPIASLNYLLTSHVWRQDHNGFSHQDPGFIDHVINKRPEVVRVYLPPDTNTLLSVADHVLRSRDYVNVVVAGKQPSHDWLDIEAAALHCARGAGIWEWASNDDGDPEVVLACAGDIPTMETLAAVDLIRRHLPDLRVRVVNVVDLMRLLPESEHPHGMPDTEYDSLFGTGVPVIFAYHGYPWLIHRLTYRRHGHPHLHVRGYKEFGTTTTPFDMVVLNDMDRYQRVIDVIDRVPRLGSRAAATRQHMVDARARHRAFIRESGEDLPEIQEWVWNR